MDIEDVKDYLSGYLTSLAELEQLERELSSVPDILKAELEERVLELKQKAVKTRRIIQSVKEPKLRLLLSCRYLEGMTFEEIAQETFLCERHIYRLHKKALTEVIRTEMESKQVVLPNFESSVNKGHSLSG